MLILFLWPVEGGARDPESEQEDPASGGRYGAVRGETAECHRKVGGGFQSRRRE